MSITVCGLEEARKILKELEAGKREYTIEADKKTREITFYITK